MNNNSSSWFHLPRLHRFSLLVVVSLSMVGANMVSAQTPPATAATVTPKPAPAPVTSAPTVSTDGGRELSATEKEAITRKQAAVFQATQSLVEAQKSEDAKDYVKAKQIYSSALVLINPSNSTQAVYDRAVQGLLRVNAVLIKEALAKGDADGLNDLLANSLTYDPKNPELLEEQAKLQKARKDPYNTDYLANPADTKPFEDKVARVQALFIEAEQFRRVGEYDHAEELLNKIISLDPYNKDAQVQLDKIIKEKMAYAEVARQQTRDERLDNVEKAWARPVKSAGAEDIVIAPNEELNRSNQFSINQKLKGIILPTVDFDDAPLQDAIQFLNVRARELDTPTKEGINFIVRPEAVESAKPITLHLRNIPLGEALRYITNLANVKYKLDQSGIFVVKLSENTDVLVRRTFTIPPSFFPSGLPVQPQGPQAIGGAAILTTATVSNQTTSVVTDALKERGVLFTARGSTAIYLPNQGQLTVVNTQDQMDLIEELVNAASEQSLMVDVQVKLVEINQTDLNDITSNVTYNMFGPLGGAGFTQYLPLLPGTFGQAASVPNPNTPQFNTQLRGSSGLNPNSLDNLEANSTNYSGTNTILPVTHRFEIGGLLNGNTFTLLLTALAQKTSTDLLSSPTVRVRSGERSSINLTRSFYYPDTFAPPQSVQIQLNNGNGGAGAFVVEDQPPAAIPAFPQSFAKQEIGVLLNLQPTVGGDKRTIDLTLAPEVTDFEGFINYGTPITIPDSTGVSRLISPNQIPQPVFNVRRVTTKVFVKDGYTVLLGGLIREDVQTITDKVPLLGDIPLVGRLFQSKSDQHIKKNLLVFVTGRILRPDGELFNSPTSPTEMAAAVH